MDKAFQVVEYIIIGLVFIVLLYIFLRQCDLLVFTTSEKGKLRIYMSKTSLKLLCATLMLFLLVYSFFDIMYSNSIDIISKIGCVANYVCAFIFLWHYQSQISQYITVRIPNDDNTYSLLSAIRKKDDCTEVGAIKNAANFYLRELNLKSNITKQFTNDNTRIDDIYNHLLSLDNIEKRMFVMNLPLEYQKDILHRLIVEEKI